MKWTLGKRTAFGSLLLALAMAGGFAALIVAVAALKRAGDATQHAEAAIVTADALERALIDLETGLRSFVITHDEASLHTALKARRQIPPLGRRLQALASGDPAQQARAAAIVRSIGTYQRTYSAPLIGVARADPARARRIVTADRGSELSDRIRAQLAEFSRAEDRRLAESRRSASAAARRAYWIAGLAGGAVLLLVLAFAGLLRRLVVRPVRELAHSARKLGHGDLAARVDVPGGGEVGELGTAFNEMAASLQSAHEEVRAERSWIESLYRFAERISAQTDVEELGRVALEQLGELTGAELGALYAGDGDDLWIAAERGLPDEVLSPFAQADRVSLGRLHELRLPLRHGDRLVGVAVLARPDGNPLDPAAVEAAESLAGPVAVALANDLAYQATRRLADINQIVLDSTRDGIVMLDPDGRRVLINDAYQRQMSEIGVPADLPFGERTQAFAERTTDPAGFVARLEGLTTDRVAETVTELTIAESGRSYQLFSSPAFEAGHFVGRVYVLHEVTGERQADRLKAELLATVSHELRTPLAGILGFAELLLRPGLDDATRTTYVETVHREALRSWTGSRRLDGSVPC